MPRRAHAPVHVFTAGQSGAEVHRHSGADDWEDSPWPTIATASARTESRPSRLSGNRPPSAASFVNVIVSAGVFLERAGPVPSPASRTGDEAHDFVAKLVDVTT